MTAGQIGGHTFPSGPDNLASQQPVARAGCSTMMGNEGSCRQGHHVMGNVVGSRSGQEYGRRSGSSTTDSTDDRHLPTGYLGATYGLRAGDELPNKRGGRAAGTRNVCCSPADYQVIPASPPPSAPFLQAPLAHFVRGGPEGGYPSTTVFTGLHIQASSSPPSSSSRTSGEEYGDNASLLSRYHSSTRAASRTFKGREASSSPAHGAFPT